MRKSTKVLLTPQRHINIFTITVLGLKLRAFLNYRLFKVFYIKSDKFDYLSVVCYTQHTAFLFFRQGGQAGEEAQWEEVEVEGGLGAEDTEIPQ